MSQRSSIGVPNPATRIDTAPAERRGITSPAPAQVGQLLGDDDAVVELDRAVPDLLDRLVALSGDDDDVSFESRAERGRDGLAAVRLDDKARGAVASGAHLLDDRDGVLAAGIVRGEHRDVREAGGDRAHQGSFCPVPVPAAPEDDDHPSGARPGFGARGVEDLLEALRGMGVVHHDRGTDVVGHRLEAPGGTGGDR